MKDELKTMEMNEKQTNERTNEQLANSIFAAVLATAPVAAVNINGIAQRTLTITIKTASYIANCNNGIKINAPMRMGNQRQKVTN